MKPLAAQWAKPRSQLILICALVCAALLATVNKPIHIDDPMFLWAARQIQAHPLNFYGFNVNWDGVNHAMWQVMQNPPLVSYYEALVASIVGWGAVPLHLAFIPIALLAMIATFMLARRLGAQPLIACLIVLASPAFLVSAGTLMSDTMMLMFWCGAVTVWVWAVQSDRPAWLIAAGVMIGLAALTKYPAAAIIPLLLAYTILNRRMILAQLAALVIPVAMLIAYQFYTRHRYGHGLLSGAGQFASLTWHRGAAEWTMHVITACAYVGGSFPAAGLLLLGVARRRNVILFATALAVLFVSLLPLHDFNKFALRDAAGFHYGVAVQIAIMAMLGIVILLVAVMRSSRSVDRAILALWIVGVFIFAAVINWTINARTLLPMAPAIGIVVAYELCAAWPMKKSREIALGIGFSIAVIVTGTVAAADTSLAFAYKSAAQTIELRSHGVAGKVWFTGHWGFQWYMERFASPVDVMRTHMNRGDLLVMNLQTSDARVIPPEAGRQIDVIELPTLPFLTTMSKELAAGFYGGSNLCALPYAFGSVPPVKISVFKLLAPINTAINSKAAEEEAHENAATQIHRR